MLSAKEFERYWAMLDHAYKDIAERVLEAEIDTIEYRAMKQAKQIIANAQATMRVELLNPFKREL